MKHTNGTAGFSSVLFLGRTFRKVVSVIVSITLVVSLSNVLGYASEVTPEASSGTSQTTSSSSSTPSAASTSGDSGTPAAGESAPAHQALSGDLPVKLSFADDSGTAIAPVAVRLQLQARAATFDAATSAWSDYGAWADQADSHADLTADTLNASDETYTFSGLSLQTVTSAGAYDTRTQYRVVESKVDGADAVWQATDAATGVMTYTAITDSIDYSITLPSAPALSATTNASGADVAELAGSAEKIATVATTKQAAPSMLALTPMSATEPAITFDKNAGDATGTMDAETINATGATVLTANGFTREGYTFAGWNTVASPTASASGTSYADGATIAQGTLTVDTTLYAQWSKEYDYTVETKTSNYATGDTTSFTLSKAASVSIDKGASLDYPAGATITVPADGTMHITFSSTTDNLVVTANLAAGQTAIYASTKTLGTVDGQLVTQTTFYLQEAQSLVNVEKDWEDGAATTKPAVSFSLQFKSGASGPWTTIDTSNIAELGLTEVPTVPAKNDALSNASASIYSFAKVLNQTDTKNGEQLYYRLIENTVPEGYVSSYSGDNNEVLVNTKLDPFEATKAWADGLDKYGTRPDIDTWLTNVICNKVDDLGGTAGTVTLTRTDPTAEGYIVITDKDNGTWSIKMPNTPGYDANDFPYTYTLTESTSIAPKSGANVTKDTVYTPTYLNNGNYASHTDALFDGGTATNTLTDLGVFTAYKKWADDGTDSAIVAARPTATVTLYRYPDDGTSNYENASPVSGNTTTTLANTSTDSQPFSFTLPTSGKLPVYDEDGYKYVYFAKETLSGGTNTYKQVFVQNGELDGNGKFVFANGEIDNTITGTVDVSGKKTWVAAARQDVNAKVTMSVYQYDPTTKTTTQLTDKDQVLTGFGTENSSLTANFAGLPEYNAAGLKYTYSVQETALQTEVGTEFKDCSITYKADNTTIDHFITADGYRYDQSATTDADGSITVSNTLVGNAQVTITKTFPDGLLVSPTSLTYTIYQNGTAIGTKSVSYTGTVGAAIAPDPITIASYSDMDAGSYTGSGLLPRYDANGVQYTYTVAETGKPSEYGTSISNQMAEGTYAEGTANAGQKYSYDNARISNSKPSDSMGVNVNKTWVDASDVMNRETVHLALQYNAGTAATPNWVTINTGSIDPSTDHAWVGVPKTVPEGATDTNTYQDLYKAWVAAGRTAGAAGAFQVVETALGSDNVVADGDSSIPENSGHRSGYSFVSTANQNYDVSAPAANTGAYDYTLTNTRVGTEKIVVNKTWIDGNNAKSSRPDSITFTVTASETVFAGGTTASEDVTMIPDADGNWKLDTGWLQKYDYATGAYITYSIAEKSFNGGNTYTSQYVKSWSHTGTGLGYVVGAHHTGDTDTYALTNSLSGSVTPYMNKYWKDLGDSTTIMNRPDIYPVLIRSYTDAAGKTHYEKMTYQDRDWDTEVVNDNWWQCRFVAQPRYNNEGYEYTYYVAEEFTSPEHGDYICSGGYTNAPDTDAGTFTENQAHLDQLNKDVTGFSKDYYVARLDNDGKTAGTIVNKPVALRTVSGTKVWSNLPTSFKRGYLPDVTFALYRYLVTQTEADAVVVTTDNSTEASKAYLSTLKSGSSEFAFGTQMDRYNSDGIPYVYIVKESSPENLTYAYDISNNTTSGLVVTNTFKSAQNFGVTFTKTWSGVPTGLADDQKPSVTLTLARYLTDKDGNVISGTREADFATSADNSNANTVTINSDVTTELWTSLAYLGPNGYPYQYRVEETNVPNGYTVYDTAGAKVTASTTTKAYEAIVTDSSTTAGAAGLTNKYGEVTTNLDVSKSWSTGDPYNATPRPSTYAFKLWRSTAQHTTPVQVGADIMLSASNDWKQTIKGAEVYSPNGETYIYIITEGADSTLANMSSAAAKTGSIAPTGYDVNSVYGGYLATSGQNFGGTVVNDIKKTSLSVTKQWAYNTTTTPTAGQLLFDMPLQAIPTSITYGFLYSTDNGSTWSVLCDNGSTTPYTRSVGQTKGVFDSVTLDNLPTYVNDSNGVAKAAMYKAYEVSVTYANNVTTSRTTGDIADTTTIGDLSTSGSTANGTTTVSNGITMRQLTISKTWADENNRDGSRPTSVTINVTRTGINSATDTATAKITLTKNTDGTVTASSNGATWDATVSTDGNTWSTSVYVPTYRNDDRTAYSSYTIGEEAITGYTYSAAAVEGGTADASAALTNTHVHTTYNIDVTKAWNDGTATYFETTMPSWFQSYLPDSLTFKLQASTNGSTWKDITDSSFGTDFNGITSTKTVGYVDRAKGIIGDVGWTGLPTHASDADINNAAITYHYRVVESLPSPKDKSFTASYSSSNITSASTVRVTNTLNLTTLTVKKTWDDSNNTYKTRPDSLVFKVQQSADNGSTWTDYTDPATSAGVTFTATVKSDGTLSGNSVTTLPKMSSDGTITYQYRAVETSLVYGTSDITPSADAIYSVSPSAGGTALTNKLKTTNLYVTKTWIDSENAYGLRPASITFKVLYHVQGAPIGYNDYKPDGTNTVTFTETVNADGTLSGGLTDLPSVTKDGTVISYGALETSFTYADGSTATLATSTDGSKFGTIGDYHPPVPVFVNPDNNEGVTYNETQMKNTLETGTITVAKTWDDNDNANGTRPSELTFTLSAVVNGTAIDLPTRVSPTVTLNAAGNWTDSTTWAGLLINDKNGNPITYTVTETTPAGYSASYKVGATTTATTGDAASTTFTQSDRTVGSANFTKTVTFTDTPIPVKIAKTTLGTDTVAATSLSGASLSIAPVNTSFTDSTTATKTWTSNGTNWDLSGLLRDSTTEGSTTTTYDYKVTETASPNGYELLTEGTNATNRYVHLQGGKLYYKDASDYEGNTGTWQLASDDNVVSIPNPQTDVFLEKIAGGKYLAGATFTIAGTFVDATDATKTTTDSITWTSTDKPYKLIGRLIVGNTYTITETAAPAGYLTMQAPYTFTMNQSGVVSSTDEVPAGVDISLSNLKEATGNFTRFQITDKPTAFTVNKYASTDTTHTTPIAGAVFTVTPASGKTFATADKNGSYTDPRAITSAADGTAGLSAMLIADTTYTIQETTPAPGFELPANNPARTIRITNAGKLQESISGIWIDSDSSNLEFSDVATKATLVKQNAADSTQIGGSTYTLTGTFADGSTPQTLTPTASAVASLSTEMIADNATTYTLKETTPVPGYKASPLTDSYPGATLTNGAMTLKMDTVGQLYYKTGETTWQAVGSNALVMKDKQNALTITKATDPATTSPTASFTIQGVFSDSNNQRETRTILNAATTATMTGKLIAGQSYAISEITPPVGYCAVSDFSITMNADGTIVATSPATSLPTGVALSADTNGNPVLTATDPQTKVTLTKTGASGNLAGAVFAITRADDGTFVDGTTTMTWNTTDHNAFDSTNFVAGQTYKFSETTIPNGYEKIADFSVTMSLAGKLQASGTVPSGVTIGDTSVTIANTQNKVTLAKQDADGKLLANARFTITDAADSTVTMNWGSSSEVADNINGWMVAGHSYVFHESSAPAGYLTVPDFTVTMGADGVLAPKGSLPSGATGTVTVNYDKTNATNSIVVKDVKTALTLKKVDTATPANDLAGATFSVEGIFADAVNGASATKSMLGGNKSTDTLTGQFVAGNTYTFTESTTPEGYFTMTSFKVKVNANGTLEFEGDHAGVSISDTTVTAANASLNAGMTLIKIDATSGSPLSAKATTFALTGTLTDGSTYAEKTLTTDENGTISVTNLPQGSYTITETATDANYVNGKFAATFSVSNACKDQALNINKDSLGTATPFNLTVTNDSGHVTANGLANDRVRGSVNIKKLGVGNDAAGLNGVTFALYKADGTFVYGARTSDGGKLNITNLPWGSYYLVETDVPAGYKIDSTHHEFTIGYGNLTKNFTDTSAISNTKNSFTLTKNAAGATFTVTGELADGTSSATLAGATSYTETGLLTGGKTYTVTETVPPAGYKVVSPFEVTMGTDGTLSAKAGTTLPDGVTLKDNAISITDSQNSITITKTDNAKPANNLAGATFELSGVDGATFAHATDSITWTTGDTNNPHAITGELIAGKVYKLTETTPAPGYTVAADTYLKIDAQGVLSSSSIATGNFGSVTGNALIIADEQNGALFAKIDAGSGSTKLVGGAAFSLKGAFADKTTEKTFASLDKYPENEGDTPEANGAFIGQLIAGNEYTLTETKPAPGYVISSWTSSFTHPAPALDASGALVVHMTNNGILEYKTGTDTWSEFDSDNLVLMKDAQNSISIIKVDAAGKALSGAQFTLSGKFADGSDTDGSITWTSSSDAKVFTGQLVAGNVYKLHEDTPTAGYTAAADVYLKVDSTGALSTCTTSNGTFAAYGSNVLTVSDTQTDITITKADAEGAALAGSTFSLSGTFADGSAPVTWTSTNTAYDLKGKLIVGNVYKLVETNPTKGYRTAADVYLKVDDAGALWTCTTSDGEFQKAASDAFVLRDFQTSFTFNKVNDGDKPLTGATFKIDGTFADGSTSMDLFSGTAVANVTGKMIAGNSYTVTETVAPPGYTAIDPFVVTVSVDGSKISVLPVAGSTAVPSGVTVAEDGFTVKVVDDPVAIVIMKTDRTTGEQLPNHDECDFRVSPVDPKVTTFVDGSTAPKEGNDDELTAALRGQLRMTTVTSGLSVQSTGLSAQADDTGTLQTTDGTLTTKGAQYIYQIQEIAEPGGYQIEPTPVQFIVDQYGDMHVLNGEGTIITSADGTKSLSFSDPAIKAAIVKTDAGGTKLAGATFKLEGEFVSGSGTTTTPITWTSTAGDPTSITDGLLDAVLIAGNTYTLTETAAPSGYDAISSSVTFTVDNLGAITLTGDASGAATLSGSNAANSTTGMIISVADPTSAATSSTAKTSDGASQRAQTLGLLAAASAAVAVESLRRRRKSRE